MSPKSRQERLSSVLRWWNPGQSFPKADKTEADLQVWGEEENRWDTVECKENIYICVCIYIYTNFYKSDNLAKIFKQFVQTFQVVIWNVSCPILLLELYSKVSQAWHCWHFRPHNSLSWGCPVHCSMFSSIPVLYPVGASCTTFSLPSCDD